MHIKTYERNGGLNTFASTLKPSGLPGITVGEAGEEPMLRMTSATLTD
jgi:hypothetical protein